MVNYLEPNFDFYTIENYCFFPKNHTTYSTTKATNYIKIKHVQKRRPKIYDSKAKLCRIQNYVHTYIKSHIMSSYELVAPKRDSRLSVKHTQSFCIDETFYTGKCTEITTSIPKKKKRRPIK